MFTCHLTALPSLAFCAGIQRFQVINRFSGRIQAYLGAVSVLEIGVQVPLVDVQILVDAVIAHARFILKT